MKRFQSVLLILCIMLFTFCFCSCEDIFTDDSDSLSKAGFQIELPEQGEEIAVMNTSEGTIKIRLFPEQAPKAVENFKTLSESGYYNGLIFHRVIEDFMIQGGDPTGTGKGGESTWGKAFEDEFSPDLLNITGSLAMANSGKNTNGSQFFINYNPPQKFSGWDYYKQYWESYKQYYDKYYSSYPDAFEQSYGSAFDMDKLTDNVKNLYQTYGGNPNLDGAYSTINKGHTVFGQVFDGLDIVKTIDKVPTDSNDKPILDVVINSISITAYEG